MSPNDPKADLAEQVHLQRKEATGRMKIARIIGPEDVRNAQTQVHAGGAARMIPFAESFNESMTATAITPGDFLKELPDGDATLYGNEGLKQSSGEHASMAHLFEEALTGISAGSEKGLPNEETGASRSGETSSGEEAALKDRAKELVTRASVKVETSEVGLDGNQASQPSVAEQKDAGEADEGSANTNNAPSFDAELKDALPAGVAQGMSQEKVHAPKEDHRSKETVKTHLEGVQRKASKKEEETGGMAAASAPEMPATTQVDTSVVAALPVPVTSSLPMMPKDLSLAGDGSFAATVTGSKSVREMAVKTQAAQKKDAAQDSLSPSKTEGGPKQSVDLSLPEAATETGKGETRAPEGMPKKGAASMESIPEKGHSLSSENGFNMVSTETPIHAQRQPISQPEKAASFHTVPTGTLPGATSMSPQIFGADAHKMLAASPTALEVGVPGGTHGWLKVRAELTGDGVVHASVSSSSLAGTEMLRRELPSLTSYLHQEQLQVSSIVVHASSSGMDGRDFAGGGQGQDPGQGAADPQGGARQESGTAYQTEDAIRSGISNEMEEQDSPLSTGYAGSGGWVSIRA